MLQLLLKFLLRYYLPVVLVFTFMDFFQIGYRSDLPADSTPLTRLALAFFSSALFSSDSVHIAWSEFGRWINPESSYDVSFLDKLLALLRLSTSGYFLMSLLLTPFYGYAWCTNQERHWEIKYLVLSWNNPRFRHIFFATQIPILIIAAIGCSAWSPLFPTIFFSLGGIFATTTPVLLTIPLGILDLYGVHPTTQVKTSIIRTPNQPPPQQNYAGNPSRISGIPQPKQQPQPPSSWRDRVNKKR